MIAKEDIMNLTPFVATQSLVEAGVFEPTDEVKARIRELLTVDSVIDGREIANRASELALIVARSGVSAALIAGPLCMIGQIEKALMSYDIRPLFSFSVEENSWEKDADGNDIPCVVYTHIGFIENEPY